MEVTFLPGLHSNLLVACCRMMIVEYCEEKLQLGDMANSFPEHIKSWTSEKKLDWLLKFLKPVTDDFYQIFSDTLELPVNFNGTILKMNVSSILCGKEIEVNYGGIPHRLSVPETVRVVPETGDELHDSSIGFIRIMLDFKVLDDIIHDGDAERLPAMLKRLCPTFIGLSSYHSKYAIECINSVTKLEWGMTELEKVKVLLRSFVNTAGKAGKNKPADLQQENNIKMVKSVVRGLGAGKTGAAIIRSSKAAPVLNSVATRYQEGVGIKIPPSIFEHHKKSSAEDCALVKTELRQIRPFHVQEGRRINLIVPPWPTDTVNRAKYIEHTKRNSIRAMQQLR